MLVKHVHLVGQASGERALKRIGAFDLLQIDFLNFGIRECFGGAIVFIAAGETKNITGTKNFDNLAPAIRQQLVEHHRALHQLVQALGGITFVIDHRMGVVLDGLAAKL